MKLWGGNYSAGPDAAFWEFNRSFSFDRRLLAEEIAASKAFVRALGRCGAIPVADAETLDRGLDTVFERSLKEPDYRDLDVEDVHSFVEERLGEVVGDLAGQAHLGRSRNEQTVTALRLWVRGTIDRLRGGLRAVVAALVEQGQAGADTVMPGFTHTRAAEPVTFGHFAAAHAWALVRDDQRLRDARGRVNVLPLGSGALAGSALDLDRKAMAHELGFEAVSPNALDAVMDRDFAVEFVSACAMLQTHLARLAEDFIHFAGPEHGFVELPEAFTTGSSLMPQKKNPDSLELVRGKAARVDGDLVRLLALLKGLPAGYQKDLQEDKEAVFDAADAALGSVAIMAGVIAGLSQRPDAMRAAAAGEEMMAAGLAVALAREGMPFRKAHGVVGALVAEARKGGRSLRDTAAKGLKETSPAVAARLDQLFDPDEAVRAKSLPGGTAPDAVRASLAGALEALQG
ncbi:MAG: argininosuccinate lyase [Acidobacteria bacterium]|jgi:argininosuccinate lyase|nr:argininosuccinate lyase [Acidobacteriota bacterium]